MSDDEFQASDDENSAATLTDAERAILDDPTKPKPPRRESKKDRAERERREADNFWRDCLSSVIGRRELWLLAAGATGAHAFETRFASGPNGFPDPNATWHAKGEQDFGLRLYHQWLRLDPSAVSKMHHENDVRFRKGD